MTGPVSEIETFELGSKDTTRSILKSAYRFCSGTMLSRLTGMLRDMAMAFAFGTEASVAAFLVAFRFAHLLRRLLGEGAMQTALIPHFEELRKENKERAGQFFCDLNLSLTIVLCLVCTLVMAAIGAMLFFDLFNAGNAEIALYTLLMMPSLLFICLFGINTSLLQCEKSFFITSAAPMIFNLVWIAGVACSYFFSLHFASLKGSMVILSLFIIIGCLLQWLVTLPKALKLLKGYGINHLWSRAAHFSKDVLKLAVPLSLGVIGVAASQINNALDAVFARWASDEGPALLWYAIRLQQLPLALFGIALSGALLPALSRAAKANDEVKFNNFLKFALENTYLLMVPITFLLLLVGDQCIALIYGHGNFSNESVIGTSTSLFAYTLGLIPMAMTVVIAPAYYAKGNYKKPAIASVAAVLLNVFLNTILIAVFGFGAASVALATSLAAWFNFFFLSLSMPSKPGVAKTLWATLIASVGVILLDTFLFGGFKPLEWLLGGQPFYEIAFLRQLIQLTADGLLFLLLFLFFALMFGIKIQNEPTKI
jgi:putative peptidoglycan lipid II flippase